MILGATEEPALSGPYALASGFLGRSNDTSVLQTFVSDKNGDALIGVGDEIVTAEYLIGIATNASLVGFSRRILKAATMTQSYASACLRPFGTNDVFFTGEPDGQIFTWKAMGTKLLQRRLFSGRYFGTLLSGYWRAGSEFEPVLTRIRGGLAGVSDLNFSELFWAFPPAASLPISPDVRWKTGFCPNHRSHPSGAISPLCAPLPRRV